jgi:hypothetical protein
MARTKQSTGTGNRVGAWTLVQSVRELTEAQFDFWIACLNRAVELRGGEPDQFTTDDRQMTVSYWYILMYLLEVYALDHNPFDMDEVQKLPDGLTGELVPMSKISRDLRFRYKGETVRRYVADLRRYRLIVQEGRGPEATLRLAAPTVCALVYTVEHWMTEFGKLNPMMQTFFKSSKSNASAWLKRPA